MANITINNEIINENFNNNATIQDIVNFQIHASDYIITSLELDGDDILSPCNQELDQNIGNYSDIKIKVQSPLELAIDALDDSARYIDNIIFNVHDVVALYEQNLPADANKKFSEVVEIMDLFIQLFSKINSTIRKYRGDILSKNTTLQKLEIHLLSILKTMLPAKEKNDIIMLCDLLEYELVDNLKQWKSQVIPELKKIGKN